VSTAADTLATPPATTAANDNAAGSPAAAALAAGNDHAAPASPSTGGPTELPPWAADLDADDRDWLAKAGHKELPKVIKSTRHLERLLGADKAGRGLVLPAEGPDADPAGWSAVYERLGRPADAAAYGLDKLEGADPAFAGEAAAAFHKAGLNPAQAGALAEWWQGKAAQGQAAADAAFQAQGEADLAELRQAWGATFDARAEAGRRAARQFGFSAEELGKIERAIGTKGLLERMATIGAALGEDGGVPSAAAAHAGAGSPAAARAEIETLKADREFLAAYLDPRSPAHQGAKAKMNRLMEQAARAG
jgi:hypothetical protein